MKGLQDILSNLDAVEVLVIKVAGTFSVLIFCYLMVRDHLKEVVAKKSKRKIANKKKEQRSKKSH